MDSHKGSKCSIKCSCFSHWLVKMRCFQLKVNFGCFISYVNCKVSEFPVKEKSTFCKLSTDCVTASSMNMFKNTVDTYLRRAGYT